MMIYLPYFVCEFNVSVTCSNSYTLMLPDHFKHFVIDVLLTKSKAVLLEEVSAGLEIILSTTRCCVK